MLAQSFKAPAELGLDDKQFDALRKTLVLLETGKIEYVPMGVRRYIYIAEPTFDGLFNMSTWNAGTECGSICCIGGTAELVGGLERNSLFDASQRPGSENLDALLLAPDGMSARPQHAARALRSYLTTGKPNWEAALGAG
jgi:hypothetical protein